MKRSIRFLVLAALLSSCVGGEQAKFSLFCGDDVYATAADPPAFPQRNWVKIDDPARLGWDQARLDAAFDIADDIGLASVFVVDDGRLVSHWGCTKREWYVASVRKSFMNAVIGRHVEAGRLALDTTLADLDIDDVAPPLTEEQRRTSLETLLTSSSGICRPAAAGSACTPQDAAARDTPFIYNNWDFNALLTVHERVSDQDFFAFFAETVARPIGMEGFDPDEDGRYERAPESLHPAYVMDMSAEDMARFGLLYLNEGVWDGRRILPADWVRASAAPRVRTGSPVGASGYGYLWWTHAGASVEEFGVPPGSFSAEGNWAQAILVVPQRRTVIVVRGYIPGLYLFGKPGREDEARFFRTLLDADVGRAAGEAAGGQDAGRTALSTLRTAPGAGARSARIGPDQW